MEAIKKTALQDIYVLRILEGRLEGPDWGECVCVLDVAAVFKSRWPLMSLEKNLKPALVENFLWLPVYTKLDV